MRILILCTGNSCRSQMAEGFLKSFDSRLDVYSAGTKPAKQVSLYAAKVMKEEGIDISNNKPKDVSIFLKDDFDYVITVCDNAKETCPIFTGKTNNRLHMSFTDPGNTVGTELDIINAHRKIRDAMKKEFYKFYKTLPA